MYTQFNISPVKSASKIGNVCKSKEVSEDIAELILAPFVPRPKILFEDVLIGRQETKQLLIKNPTNRDTELFVIQLPSPELNINLSWLQNTVPAQSEILLEITWCPNILGGWREVLILEDCKRVRREIPIVLKSTCPKTKKPIKRAKTKSPTLLSKKLKLSPLKRQTRFTPRRIRVSPKLTKIQDSRKKRIPPIVVQDVASSQCEMKYEQNALFNRSSLFLSPSKIDFEISPTVNIRRETYLVESRKDDAENIPPEDTDISKDSLEISPDLNSDRILKKLNSLSFTPVTTHDNFNPTLCSSVIPKRNLSSNKSGVMKELFINTNVSHEVSQIASPSPNLSNLSSETYLIEKNNVSTETYVKENISTRTYMKENVSNSDIEYVSKQMRMHFIDNETVFTLSNEVDPFMSSSIYFFDNNRYESYFVKWLNALLTPPVELNVQESNIDVAKLWQECKHKDVAEAATKEAISNIYHTNARLTSLRKTAKNFYRSARFSEPICKAMAAVEASKIVIRTDKNVHLDLSLQKEVMSLLMSYNPLWLRIGLETIYDTIIPLSSNSDVLGLSRFIVQNFFKDPSLLKKYKSVLSNDYGREIKKFIFKKFLVLVYFLDQAKLNKIISHDPCLFVRSALYKESRDVLLNFSKELVSAGSGDITRFLRQRGYVLSYKQTYIDEFDYAIKCLGSELRDGVRLAKVMEIILVQEGLTKKMRVPAISRLQKIHNMSVVFNALYNAGFNIEHGIEPKDIVDGHKEKTLSLLWQIVNKFQLPRIEKATIAIQSWWKSTRIIIKRRILKKRRQHLEEAAQKIQKWYRNIKRAQKIENFLCVAKKYLVCLKRDRAATKIQAFFKMLYAKRRYQKAKKAIIFIQSHARRLSVKKRLQKQQWAATKIQSVIRCFAHRKRYLRMKMAVLIIEERYVATKLALKARSDYLQTLSAVIFVQRKFRANKIMREHRDSYTNLRAAVFKIQKWYRSIKAMKIERQNFLRMKKAVIDIETRYEAVKMGRTQRKSYQALRHSTILIQQTYRAKLAMRIVRKEYLTKRKACLTIQRYFKGYLLMKKEMAHYKRLKSCAIFIQRKYRGKLLMKKEKSHYERLKTVTVSLQRKFRSTISMKKEKTYYDELKRCTVAIQRRFRANVTMKKERDYYKKLKLYTVFIQRQFRANILMKKQKRYYDKLKTSAVFIQRRFRANLLMKNERDRYGKLKSCTVLIQRKFRAKIVMRKQWEYYEKLKKYTVFIQRKYRARRLMKIEKAHYERLKKCAIITQRRFRAKLLMKKERDHYEKLKSCTVLIQRKIRAKILMKNEKERYAKLKDTTIFIQRKFRAHILMKQQQDYYNKLKSCTVFIQRKFRAKILMKRQKAHYEKFKTSATFIQRKFRAKMLMRKERTLYITLKSSTIFVQRKFRAKLSMKKDFGYYNKLKSSTVFIQRRFRANVLMKKEKAYYDKLTLYAVFIQRKFRAKLLMRNTLEEFQKLKKVTVVLQNRYRAKKLMRLQRNHYNIVRKSALSIQRCYRNVKLMHTQRSHFLQLRRTVLKVQARFRANREMKIQRNYYQSLRKATIQIQVRYRALKEMKRQRLYYLKLKSAAVTVQRRFRANRLMKEERNRFIALKRAVDKISCYYKAYKLMSMEKQRYEKLKRSVVFIQRKFRANRAMKVENANYKKKLSAVITLQKYVRGFLARNSLNKAEIDKLRLLKKQRIAATKIQALWRGYVIRKSNPKYAEMTKRLLSANSEAVPEKRLCFRKDSSIKILVNENSSLESIIFALENLDFVVRRCRDSCTQLSKMLTMQLYIVILSSNKSPGEIQAATLATSILISFCKYPKTTDDSWKPELMKDVIAKLVSVCDLEYDFFPYLCTLVWLFAHNDTYKDVIKKIPDLEKRLNKAKVKCERKQNMWNACRNKKIPSVFETFSEQVLPVLAPDWGVEYQHRPRTFKNSVHAINSVLSILR